MPKIKKALVLLSGGLDSSLAAYKYLDQGYEVLGVFVDYGQPWGYEKDAFNRVIKHLGIPGVVVNTTHLPVKEKCFIPMRNAHLLTIACAEAYVRGYPHVVMGSNIGEFLDQSSEFVDRFNFMLDYCFKEDHHPWVWAPFCNWSKDRIMKYAISNKFPVEITTSCMHTPQCGKCLPCKVRRKYGVKEEMR